MKKILIIEDDAVLRENTAEFISGENFEVFVAKDGLEGVQQTLQHLPDLILCDISMPNMNGYDFYKTIKQIKVTSTIPLVFFSAKTENEDIRVGMQLGADDYIIKPFDFFELLKVIKTRLAKYDTIKQVNDEKFHALIKHPTLGMFIYQNGKFIYYNETLASIFGHTKEDFSTITFKELIEDDESQIKILNDIDLCLIDPKGSISISFLARHNSMGMLRVELFGTVITYKGQPSIIGNIISLKDNLKATFLDSSGINEFKLSKRTIDTHRANLLSKTTSKNSAELIIYAIKNQLVVIK
jgi:DNA-binding response OmpR family regulator